jgi:multidrug resistance efflux pump
MRSIGAERSALSPVGLAVVVGLLAAWSGWFFRSEVTVYETSETARVEVQRAAHTIDAPVAGRIQTNFVVLGLEVQAGDLLVEIDAEPERTRLAAEAVRLRSLAPEVDALRLALEAQEQALVDDRGATAIAMDEARAKEQEAAIATHLATEEAARASRLLDSGSIAELELLRTRSEAARRRAETDALSLDVERQRGNQRTRDSQARVRADDLRREIAALEGQEATTQAAIDVLRHDIERRSVRASIAGRIGDAPELRAGAYVHEGQNLGAIVPAGELKIVADFSPGAALGRVRPGQRARVRLDGYPWIQFGTVSAVVTRMASELRDGTIRVEFAAGEPPAGVTLEHGLTGSVEVEVDRVTPAVLVLRSIGKPLARRALAPPVPIGDAPLRQAKE